MANFQAAYNRTQVCIRASLEKEVEKFTIGKLTSRRKDLKALAQAKLVKYKSQAFGSNGALYPKAKDAAYAFQCPSPAGFEDTGITSWKCASGCCCKCGQLPVPDAEKDWVTPVNHYIFKNLPTCGSCGALPEGSTSCPLCAKKPVDQRDKIGKRKHMVLDRKPFPKFKELYLKTLEKYCTHRFKFLILSKKYTVDVRQDTLRPGEVCFQHDFAEALKIVHNQEVSLLLVSILFVSTTTTTNPLPLLQIRFCFRCKASILVGALQSPLRGTQFIIDQ